MGYRRGVRTVKAEFLASDILTLSSSLGLTIRRNTSIDSIIIGVMTAAIIIHRAGSTDLIATTADMVMVLRHLAITTTKDVTLHIIIRGRLNAIAADLQMKKTGNRNPSISVAVAAALLNRVQEPPLRLPKR